MVGGRKAGLGLGHLDAHVHRPVGGEGLEQLADRGERGLVTREEEGGRVPVDGVAAAWTGDRRHITGLRRVCPLGREPTAVDDDFEVELERVTIEAPRREGSDRWASPVWKQELVAVPARHDELFGTRRREQQPYAGRGLLDGQTLELG